MKELEELHKIVMNLEKIERVGRYNLSDLQEWLDHDAIKLWNILQDLHMEVERMEKELDEKDEEIHRLNSKISDMEEWCTGCNRPAMNCGCDEDWRRDR